MTTESLDWWPRFVSHALDRAYDKATLAAVAKSLLPPDLHKDAITPIYPVEKALAAGAAVLTGGVSGLVGAAARAIGGAVASEVLASTRAPPVSETASPPTSANETPPKQPVAPESEPESRGGAAKLWAPPEEVIEKIPREWGPGQPTRKGTGLRWTDPQNPKANIVRIDKGNPKAALPSQRPDHAVVQSHGKVLGRDGKPIVGSIQQNASAAHIPINEYRTWSKWNKL